MAVAGVIEAKARAGRAPVFQHPLEPPLRQGPGGKVFGYVPMPLMAASTISG